uniref:Uncharacterized protein n=1 Tax=Kalanchoe fedtschenkoi TaxID=63787 RepID=A0A7N0VAS6_KALFE
MGSIIQVLPYARFLRNHIQWSNILVSSYRRYLSSSSTLRITSADTSRAAAKASPYGGHLQRKNVCFPEKCHVEMDCDENKGLEAFLLCLCNARLRQKARPESLLMAKVNQERLAEFLGELQRKEDTNDRYVAALKGETLTRNPYVRIQPVPQQNDSPAASQAASEQKN